MGHAKKLEKHRVFLTFGQEFTCNKDSVGAKEEPNSELQLNACWLGKQVFSAQGSTTTITDKHLNATDNCMSLKTDSKPEEVKKSDGECGYDFITSAITANDINAIQCFLDKNPDLIDNVYESSVVHYENQGFTSAMYRLKRRMNPNPITVKTKKVKVNASILFYAVSQSNIEVKTVDFLIFNK